MNLLGNTIAIDKVPEGTEDLFRLTFNTEAGQVVQTYTNFDALAEFLVDSGFAPMPTT